jgi:hypothetical protein
MSMNTETVGDQSRNQANRVERDEALRGWIAIILSVLLVCLTAGLFTAGHAYRLGYLYELGFDLAQLPEDFNETSFWGFSGGTPLALAWLVVTLIVLFAYGLLFWLAGVLWKAAQNRWRGLRRRAPSTATAARRVETHVKLILGACLVLPVTYLVAVAYLGTAELQKAGTKRGKQLVEALRADAPAASAKYGTQMIELWFNSPADPVVSGYRLLCTESLCSIYDPNPKVHAIRLVSLANVREIRMVDRHRP